MKSFFGLIWEFIKRNPFLTLFIVMFVIAAPQLLGVFALMLFIPLLIVIIGALVLAWRVRKVRKSMEDQLRNHGYHTSGSGFSHTTSGSTDPVGKVTVHIPHQEPRINDEVGEYVDFKEEK